SSAFPTGSAGADPRPRRVRVGRPSGSVSVVRFIAPTSPVGSCPSRKELDVGREGARFDERVLLVRFAAVLLLPRRQRVPLSAAGLSGSCMLAANAKQHELGHVAEIEADAAAVTAAILPYL